MKQKLFTKEKYEIILKLLQSGKKKKNFKIENNKLYYNNLIVINENEKNISLNELYKQFPYGRDKLYQTMNKTYWYVKKRYTTIFK